MVANEDVRLDWITEKYSASEVMWAGFNKSDPQQLTIPSTVPKVLIANSIKESTWEKSDASRLKNGVFNSSDKVFSLDGSLPANSKLAPLSFKILETTCQYHHRHRLL